MKTQKPEGSMTTKDIKYVEKMPRIIRLLL